MGRAGLPAAGVVTCWPLVSLVPVPRLRGSGAGAAAEDAPDAAPRAANAPISTEDIKAAYEKGDYQETLRLLGRVLALKGKAADPYDRYELLLMRAESHLKL